MEILPPLRQDVDFVPVRHEGREVLVIRDPLGIAEPGLALKAEIAQLLPFFDGTTSVRDLQLSLARQSGGSLVPGEQIASLVGALDRLGLLQTRRYREARDAIVEEFASRREREAALAGSAYSTDPAELAAEVDGHLARADGRGGTAAGAVVRGIAAPHIDFRVADTAYGLAYRPLRHLSPSAVLVLGTGHSLETPYCLTDKTFLSPLGAVSSEGRVVSDLREAGGQAVSKDDFAHRSEHSIEFQLLFLQRILPMTKIPIVPLLCGSLEPYLLLGKTPLEDPDMKRFVEALGTWLSDPPAGKIVVAGVDLSHVGPKFGDTEDAETLEEAFRASDGRLLEALEEGDPSAFYESVASTGNRYKVCGFSALWTLLAVLPGVRGRIMDYRVWHERPTRSAVSFAAVTFTGS